MHEMRQMHILKNALFLLFLALFVLLFLLLLRLLSFLLFLLLLQTSDSLNLLVNVNLRIQG
jgi:hypothetical protein